MLKYNRKIVLMGLIFRAGLDDGKMQWMT